MSLRRPIQLAAARLLTLTQVAATIWGMPHTEPPGQPASPGPRLRKLRQDAGVRPRELAAAIGISTSHLRSIENGFRSLTPELRARICRHLGIDPEDLPSVRELAQAS